MHVRISALLMAFGLVGLAVLVSACGKEKYTTKPQLTFKEAKNYTVPRGGLIEMELEVTDKEGDLTDTIFIETITTRCNSSNRKLSYRLPAFPLTSNAKAQLNVTFANGVFLPGYVALPGPACGRPDTTTFRFWIKDAGKNVSDTVTTDKPIIILN